MKLKEILMNLKEVLNKNSPTIIGALIIIIIAAFTMWSFINWTNQHTSTTNESLETKNTTIENLQKTLETKNTTIENLQKTLETKNTTIENLQKSGGEKFKTKNLEKGKKTYLFTTGGNEVYLTYIKMFNNKYVIKYDIKQNGVFLDFKNPTQINSKKGDIEKIKIKIGSNELNFNFKIISETNDVIISYEY